jgi:MFS family permease
MLSPAVAYPCLIVFCLMWTHGLMAAYLPLYAESQGTNPGVFFLVLALVVAAVRGYAGQVSDRVGRAPVAAIGLALTARGLGVLAAGHGPWGLVLAGGLHGLGFGTAQPPLMAWAVDLVPAAERGKAMGTYYTALELGIAAGAMGSGMILPYTGFRLLFLLVAALPLTGATLALARLHRGAR